MKVYPLVELTSDKYLNPDGYIWNDNEGSHYRHLNQITSFSIHHDAAPRPHGYDSVGRYHTEATEHYLRLGFGLQYHFKIDNQGTIFQIRPLDTWLNCIGSAENLTTLAICLDGNFETETPTQEQFEALKQLLDDLSTNHPEFPAAQGNVWPHDHFSATACCGANLIPWVNMYRDNMGAVGVPQVGYDWPTMQANPMPPAPAPPATLPPAVHPAPVPTPISPKPGTTIQPVAGGAGQPSGPVTVTPAPSVLGNEAEFVQTFLPFPGGNREIHVKEDTVAIDLTGVYPPKQVLANSAVQSSGTLMESGKKYYRGTSGGWYGIAAEEVVEEPKSSMASSESKTNEVSALTLNQVLEQIFKDPLGVLIRWLTRRH